MKAILFQLLLITAFSTVALSQSNTDAKASRYNGILVFSDCTPVKDYEYLGTVKRNTGGFGCSQYECVRDGLIEKAKEDYPEVDGIILNLRAGGKDQADAIKFND